MGGLLMIPEGMTTTPGVPPAPNTGTYDFNTLQSPCDHQIHMERYQVNPRDLRTLQLVANPLVNMRAPINGRALVQVFIHGELAEPDHPVYGYQVVVDPDRLQRVEIPGLIEVFYKIVFDREVRLVRPLIEVNYLTRIEYCLKCASYGVLNDLQPSNRGSFSRLTLQAKLAQRCLKFMLASRCAFYPQFTCPIKDYIGRKFGVTITDADITNGIMNSLENIRQIQIAQNAFQPLAPEETLQSITNVSAFQDAQDPTIVHVSLSVVSFSSTNINTLVSTPINFSIQVSA